MTHEFKEIVQSALLNQSKNIKSVLATVVDLEGSSYRQPGVRMLLLSNGNRVGAVSGGCVEKEVWRAAQTVFKTGESKIITYDGRYRLGCEGVLYILLEAFEVSEALERQFLDAIAKRKAFTIHTFYKKEDQCVGAFYSTISFEHGETFAFSKRLINENSKPKSAQTFSQYFPPCFKLLIIGGEHDAVKLCVLASQLGWEVEVVTSIKDPKTIEHFPGASKVMASTPETFNGHGLDCNCAVVLMTHNFAQDLRYLLNIKHYNLAYIGLLGSVKRREQLKNDLFEYQPDLDDSFLERIYSPAGLNLGAITPEEIALSILSEILAITRNTIPMHLKHSMGTIHAQK